MKTSVAHNSFSCTSCIHDNLVVVTYNLHGFNQGLSTIKELCVNVSPDIMLLQEHWLTDVNMCKIEQLCPDYVCIGSAAAVRCCGIGLGRGRPAGGTATLIKRTLQHVSHILHISDRCVITKIHDYVVINVYLPCSGTENRLLIIEEILNDIMSCIDSEVKTNILIGGDFNCDLEGDSKAAELINVFMRDLNLLRCDVLCNCHCSTYRNLALNVCSCLDYFLINNASNVINMLVIDEGSNLSDHLPIALKCRNDKNINTSRDNSYEVPLQRYLRWDHGNLDQYYFETGIGLQQLLNDVNLFIRDSRDKSEESYKALIDRVYADIVSILNQSAHKSIPTKSKTFYKFWWDEELSCKKEESVNAHRLWLAAGRPRCGPIACNARACKMRLKRCIKLHQRVEQETFNNELYERLIHKDTTKFWKCWRSRFNVPIKQSLEVNGLTSSQDIADNFLLYFKSCCSELTAEGNHRLFERYVDERAHYYGTPFDDKLMFDVELVDSIIRNLDRGKAAGHDGLTAEHLQNCHPALISLLTTLYNLMIKYSYVPQVFGSSVIIPLPKSKFNVNSKIVSVDDFRGISIRCVLSKIFEKCILNRYERFFVSSENQFGFKKNSGCTDAIFTVRRVVDYYVSQGSTVNLCTLDLSKAFDKMNRYGLLLKLMDRKLPNNLLDILEYWFSVCQSCVRWGGSYSNYMRFTCGVPQGGVLSPHLFAVFIDDIVKVVKNSNSGCYIGIANVSIFLYADDIVILAPTVSALQELVHLCEIYLKELDMSLNSKKSVCIRIGKRYKEVCKPIVTLSGEELCWSNVCRYLGVQLVSAKKFKIVWDSNKSKFYNAANAILGKLGRTANEEVIVNLLVSKCVPMLTYGMEVIDINRTMLNTLDFIATRTTMKIFNTNNLEVVNDCQARFHCLNLSQTVLVRKKKFLTRYMASENNLCKLFKDAVENELYRV